MKMNGEMRCMGFKASEGEMEGQKSSSTTFHMRADLASNSWGDAIGGCTVKMKFGDASEFQKWKHLKASWPDAGVMLPCVFDMVASGDGKPLLTLLDVKPPLLKAA